MITIQSRRIVDNELTGYREPVTQWATMEGLLVDHTVQVLLRYLQFIGNVKSVQDIHDEQGCPVLEIELMSKRFQFRWVDENGRVVEPQRVVDRTRYSQRRVGDVLEQVPRNVHDAIPRGRTRAISLEDVD